MLKWKTRSGLAVAALLILAGCANTHNGANCQGKNPADVQERLSSAIARNGFNHSLRSDRRSNRRSDSIYISIPLDGLKHRHYSLENLMRDVGRICAQPDYDGYAIRLEIAAGDAEDRRYLRDFFVKEVANKPNVSVSVESDRYDDILITTEKAR